MDSDTSGPRRHRVRLRRRQDIANPSLFARLSPSLAEVLHKEALDLSSRQEDRLDGGKDMGWSIRASAPQNNDGKIEFLPLAVSFLDPPQVTIYVSYNGGEAFSDENNLEGVLELPGSVIPDGHSGGTHHVLVRALPSIRDADILQVEPLTCDDWELLEIQGEFLENGGLLQQLSVVYPNQVVSLRVGAAHDVATIRVLGDHSNFEGECCLRLLQDTRISVVPKPRPKLDPISPPLRIHPSAQDYSQPMNKLAETKGKPQTYTTPGTVFVHPATRDMMSGFVDERSAIVLVWNAATGSKEPSNEESGASCLLQVSISSDVPKGYIVMHFLTRARLRVTPFVDTVRVRILSPIEVLRGSSILGNEIAVGENQDTAISTTSVDPRIVRTASKWRYPNNLNVSSESAMRVAGDCGSHSCAREPMDNGSFWLESSSQLNKAYRVSFNQPSKGSSHDEVEGIEQRAAPMDRSFVFREELEQMVLDGVEASHVVSKSESFEVRQSPHLVNLLPETSLISSALQAKIDAMTSTGDALVFGESGSGKTHTALLMAAFDRFARHSTTLYLDCKKLKDSKDVRMKNILSAISQVFQEANSSSVNSTIILDDLDEIAPNLQSGSDGGSAQSHQVNPVAVDQAKLVGDFLRRQIERKPGCSEGERGAAIIVTCRQRTALIPSVANARPFARTMETPNLTPAEKEMLLWNMITSGADSVAANEEAAFKSRRIGRKCEGFRPQDILLLASKAKHLRQGQHDGDHGADTVARHIESVLEGFTPLRKHVGNDNISGDVEWDDIGGLADVKEALTSTILNPAKYRRIYEKAKIRLPRGVLVFGCPGNGKSLLVPALARKCGFSLITCRGPELLDRYIGASEAKVRDLFARAVASSPAILFFDEIDSLAPRRGSDRTGVTDRVVNQLLTLLDGVEDTGARGAVYIVAATSRPDIVDPALLRPGRLEKHLYVGYPENDEESVAVLLKIASRYELEEDLLQSISSGQFVQDLKHSSPDFGRLSAADLKAGFDTAQLSAIHKILQTDPTREYVVIEHNDLFAALRSTRPSLGERDYEALQAAYKPFRKVSGEDPREDSRNRDKVSVIRTALR